MNIVWGALIILVVTAAAVAVMLAVRRRAPEGSYFADSDRAAGIFGVIATGFSVLLGFLIFLGFESYDASRAGAEGEALTVAQQIQTAQVLPASVGAPLTGQLVCYARSVINDEWTRMENGTLGEDINPWGVAMFRTLQGVELGSPQEEAAYGKWLDQTSTREEARQDRIHGAAGLMPTPLWIALFFISAVVLLYLLGFADSSERAWVQAMYMGSVVAVITTLLLLLSFLDAPFRGDVGGLEPVAMERTELLIDQQLAALGGDVTIPCDDAGIDVTATEATSTDAPARRDWVEIVATVLLAFAAVATAWSSYQANRWNGETTKASSRVNALRIEAARAQGLAQAQTQVDIAMYFQWVNATETDEPELAEFYEARFRPEFRPAFDAWLATDPITDPEAPPTPFAMDEYQLQAGADVKKADAEAEVVAAVVRRNIQRSANYVLAVVLFAVALFFAGMSTKLHGAGSRKALLVVGCLVFLGTAAWIATFPISVSV